MGQAITLIGRGFSEECERLARSRAKGISLAYDSVFVGRVFPSPLV